VPSSFAYELEAEAESLKKEVDALKVKLANQADRIRYLEGATNHACGTPLSNAIKERDEAIAGRQAYKQLAVKHAQERDEAREDLKFRRGFYKVQVQYLEMAKRERDEAIRLLIEASEYSTTTSQENTEKFLRKIGKWEEAK
jgi:hypothetical protein